ncbi:hypothetical protein CEXT_440921 [Caerostris extrusa]|uniref:Uncharacterized protein n=1 Tax=Caerostris extrusa TaxID=172846 RepID=A0AAV4R3T4_CAEEX|nr:hypothetical protein CEXT_440921 [Caerostris extrusa]
MEMNEIHVSGDVIKDTFFACLVKEKIRILVLKNVSAYIRRYALCLVKRHALCFVRPGGHAKWNSLKAHNSRRHTFVSETTSFREQNMDQQTKHGTTLMSSRLALLLHPRKMGDFRQHSYQLGNYY